jgi:hypothetical protein
MLETINKMRQTGKFDLNKIQTLGVQVDLPQDKLFSSMSYWHPKDNRVPEHHRWPIEMYHESVPASKKRLAQISKPIPSVVKGIGVNS